MKVSVGNIVQVVSGMSAARHDGKKFRVVEINTTSLGKKRLSLVQVDAPESAPRASVYSDDVEVVR